MYYLLNFPRPIGIEPTVYTTKPEITPEIVEVYPGHFEADPYTDPNILEFYSVKQAIEYIIEFNGTDDYLKKLRIG
jgi:hypothetical protein